MSSSHLPSHSPGEEIYPAAEEYHPHHVRSSSGASSTVTTTPNGSVYATANQTPTASPEVDRGVAPSVPVVAQDQDPSESLRPSEQSPEERRKRSSPNATAAPRDSSNTYSAEANTDLEQQRGSLKLRSGSRAPEKDKDVTSKRAYLTIISANHIPTTLPESFPQQRTCDQA